MQYNLYSGNVEFMKNGEVMVLAKNDAYRTVNFADGHQILKLVHYNYRNKIEYGYLFEIFHKNDITLYSKSSVTYVKPQKAKSSYDMNIKAAYKNNPEVYFIKNGNSKIVEMPTNKRKMIEMFPAKKQVLTDYFNRIKIDFYTLNLIILV